MFQKNRDILLISRNFVKHPLMWNIWRPIWSNRKWYKARLLELITKSVQKSCPVLGASNQNVQEIHFSPPITSKEKLNHQQNKESLQKWEKKKLKDTIQINGGDGGGEPKKGLGDIIKKNFSSVKSLKGVRGLLSSGHYLQVFSFQFIKDFPDTPNLMPPDTTLVYLLSFNPTLCSFHGGKFHKSKPSGCTYFAKGKDNTLWR